LWERSRRADGSWLHSCTLITVPANRLLSEVHNGKPRMPALLPEGAYDTWLHEAQPQAQALLQPYPDELMRAWQVSRRVNNPRLPNEASLIEPV
jgi:putative SOS response-associated peptidase YedK